MIMVMSKLLHTIKFTNMIHVLISTTFDDEVHFDMGLLFIVKLEAYCRKPSVTNPSFHSGLFSLPFMELKLKV